MANRRQAGKLLCRHQKLYTDCSPEARRTGFERLPKERRLAAASPSGRVDKVANGLTVESVFNDGDVFPGPLVLPDDAIAIDPKDAPQSFRSQQQTMRKQGFQISTKKKVIYLVPPPKVSPSLKGVMRRWHEPRIPKEHRVPELPTLETTPSTELLRDYIQAFYHPLEVKILTEPFTWRSAKPAASSKTKQQQQDQYIELVGPGLSTPVAVRYRPSPDGIAAQQLNLNDILDSVVQHLPADGCSIVMMLDHDLYEDDDDDFCCGRAYGADGIAVVSSFRYHPGLDRYSDIDQAHMWPASHCQAYVDELCRAEVAASSSAPPPAKRVESAKPPSPAPSLKADSPPSALAAAVAASRSWLVPVATSRARHEGLWFSRVARTLAHELGHCFIMDHCVYFACLMQGTASMAEDVRQPPYLCPVCLQKLSWSLSPFVGNGAAIDLQRLWVRRQHEALRELCHRPWWKEVGMFAGFAAWLDTRLGMPDLAGSSN
jgi:predicted Zn-dependent protease